MNFVVTHATPNTREARYYIRLLQPMTTTKTMADDII